MKRVLLQSILVIVGIVLGGAVGGYLTFHKYARECALVRAFAWAGMAVAVSENQYDQNSSHAKQDLLYSLDIFTQGIQSSSIDPTMNKALRMKRGLIEARLSVLENEAGNIDLGKSYLSKAQEDLKTVGWVDRSEANILQVVKRQPVAPCGAPPQNTAKTITSTSPNPCG